MFFTENVALRCIFRNLPSITGMQCDNVTERHVMTIEACAKLFVTAR